MSSLFAEYEPRPPGAAEGILPDNIVFAEATADDAAAIARLLARREGLADEQARERVTHWLELPKDSNFLLVARMGMELGGYGRAGHIEVKAGEARQPVPRGWYLSGVVVDESFRRRGIGRELTRRRLAWIGERACEAFYFVNSLNRASIDLHRQLGFVEACTDFHFPGVRFGGGGIGILYRAALPPALSPK